MSCLQNTWMIMMLLIGAPIAVSTETLGDAPRAEDPSPNNLPPEYWAFQPVKRSEVPSVQNKPWVRSPIDAFVLDKLEREGLEPAADADRITLIRRASLDLIGYPPAPDAVQAFVDDRSDAAFDAVVDRLLASPHYGERMGRHWLDLARYAESAGFEKDATRPNAWRYRDYVIDAFNRDKPYNRFVREQIAGDELWPDDFTARIATAFNRHYPEEGNNKDLLLARQEILHDITDVVGATFLGLTFGCARCHDHKYDPISQRDYYRLQAFFANVGHDDRFPLVSKNHRLEYERRLRLWEEKTQAIWDEMDAILQTKRAFTPAQLLARYPDYVIEAIQKPAHERSPIEAQMAYLLSTKNCNTCPLKPKPYLNPNFRRPAKSLEGTLKARYEALERQLETFVHLLPPDVPRGSGIIDISNDAPPTYVLAIGMYTAPLEEVQPGFPASIDPSSPRIAPLPEIDSTGRRSALANWLADARNPLTARVMVNRIWHYHFGRGIVATPSDFGTRGENPTHRALLDWLAAEFVESGWSVKHMHRLIMTSSVYRQNSYDREDAGRIDPANRLLWRFPPQRLEAEAIRDSALAVSGLLNRKLGGPSVFPPLPPGMTEPTGGWQLTEAMADHQRRSVYIFLRRNNRYPLLKVFDLPDSHASCARRNTTTTPPQAMALLNSELSRHWARAFAARVLKSAGPEPSQQVEWAFQFAYSRAPDAWEKETSLAFLRRQANLLRSHQADAKSLVLPPNLLPDVASHDAAALVDYCLMLLNANEFVYRF